MNNLSIEFPSYAKDIENPGRIKDVLLEYEKDDLLSLSYYTQKLHTCLHEAGHAMAILLTMPDGINDARIYCEIKKDDIDKNGYYFCWGGEVNYSVVKMQDSVLDTIISVGSMAAMEVFGINRLASHDGAGSDMNKAVKNRLKNTKRMGCIDRNLSWSHQKNEYKALMDQEANVLFLYTKQIMDENKQAIKRISEKLYEKETLSQSDILDSIKDINLCYDTLGKLKLYINEFYKK